MKSLRDVKVFEVDHPATQEAKKMRLNRLDQCAAEVILIPIDFTKDDLGQCLDRAGLDKNRKTVWIWEGVVMYLTPDQIRHTMQCIAARSSPDSILALSYLPHSLRVGSYLLSLIGEPILTVTPAGEFHKLADGTGWHQVSDTGIAEWRDTIMDGKRVWFQRLHSKRWYERIWVGSPESGADIE